LIVGGQDQAPALMAWLDQYLFVEQVELCDLSAQSAIALVIGAKAQDALEALAPSPERFVMRSFDYVDASQNPVPAYLVCGSPLARAPHIDADTLETLRIGAGIPWFPNEVNEAFNPLELGLTQAIHWAKGCYTGQEVISRLDTYSKLNKKLCRLKATKADFSELEAGQSVLHSGKSVGTLSSLAPQYWPGHACALGVFKFAPDADLSQPLAVQTSNRLVHLDLFQ
jgi:folate-binding protein YgfZ